MLVVGCFAVDQVVHKLTLFYSFYLWRHLEERMLIAATFKSSLMCLSVGNFNTSERVKMLSSFCKSNQKEKTGA